MNENKILLSALFHDIGKVLERTKEYKSKELPEKFQSSRYAHPKFSALFLHTLTKEKENITDFLKNNIDDEVIDLVLNHHDPQNEYELILQISDWIASSEREKDETQKGSYIDVPLRSIFSKVDSDAKDLYYPLSTLENIYPNDKENLKIGEEKYSELVNPFLKLIPKVENIDQLLTLFEFYLSNVPAQTTNYSPDISIYDHSRITACLAHILYRNLREKLLTKEDLLQIKEFLKQNIDNSICNKPLFTLISGDLSGIQSFLFNVTSESAGKMLKGKSVFLDLLTRYSAKYILDKTGFTRVNIIYVGGGNFDILISHTHEDVLSNLRDEIVKSLWYLVGDDLYLGIEWIHLSIKDLLNFIEKREELRNKLDERKKRKYKELSNFYELIFTPKDEKISDREYCTICGRKKIYEESSGSEFTEARWCKTCKSFIDFTEELKKANYLIEEKSSLEKEPESVKEFFEKLGYSLAFSEDRFRTEGIKVYKLEEVSLEKDFIPDGFILGSFKVVDSNFENIASRNIQNGYGDKKLAYLKMDADNMGNIFKKLSEIEKEREGLSLTRFGVLSRRIELFFGKGVLELIKESRNEFYPVYIGGDDLFIIGTVDKVNNLIKKIKEKYFEYTGSKDIFTISGGLYYLPYNFPLIRGAHIVEESLEKAKSFRYPEEDKPKKGKLCVEGEVLTYTEFEKSLEIANELKDRILSKDRENKASRAIISKIENSIKGFNPLLEQSLKGRISPPAIWRFLYYLRDYKDIAKKLEEIILCNILERGEKFRNPRLILVATKIAKIKTRRGES